MTTALPRGAVSDAAVAVEHAGRLIAWVPGRLVNPLNGPQGGWRGKASVRRAWRDRTRLCVKDAVNRAMLTLVSPSSVRGWTGRVWLDRAPKVVVLTASVWNLFDDDGLRAACKPVVDGLVDAHVIHGDGPMSGHRIEYRQSVDRLHRGVEVVVEPRAFHDGCADARR